MTDSISRPAAVCAMFACACSWPLHAWQRIPGLPIGVTGVAASIILLALALELRAGVRLRVTLDLLWPAAGLAVLTLLASIVGTHVPVQAPAAIVVFIAAAHFAADRDFINRLLGVSALAGGGAAAIAIVFRLLGGFPTAFNVPGGPTVHLASTVGNTVFTYLTCLGLSFVLAFKRPIRLRQFAVYGVAAVPLVLELVLLARSASDALYKHFDAWLIRLDLPQIVLVAVAIWLCFRVLSKVCLDRIAYGAADFAATLVPGFAALCLLFVWPLEPVLAHGWLLGLAAGYALPERAHNTRVALWWAPAGALVCLAGVHVSGLLPVDRYDPRNYDMEARDAYRDGRFDDLWNRMQFIETIAPDEPRAYFWRARASLQQNALDQAADEFQAALQRADTLHPHLPPPTPEEIEAFLVRLRDRSMFTQDARRTRAYERALIASGGTDASLFRLRLALGPLRYANLDLDPTPLRRGVALVLGGPSLADAFEPWSMAELLTLMANWGADIALPDVPVPADRLPTVFLAYQSGEAHRVVYIDPARMEAESIAVGGTGRPPRTGSQRLSWRSELAPGRDRWRVVLVDASTPDEPIATVTNTMEPPVIEWVRAPAVDFGNQIAALVWLP